jgi:hypothetical protein
MDQCQTSLFDTELDRLNRRRRQIECSLRSERSPELRMGALAELRQIEHLLADIHLDMQRSASMEGGE